MVTVPSDVLAASEMAKKLPDVFTPHQPISLPEFLRGRLDLIFRLQDNVNTEGLHVVLYGDRGTGKTSLARVAAHIVQEPDNPKGRRCIIVSCTADDSFSSIWRKVGQEILMSQRQMGFGQHETLSIAGRLDLDSTIVSPNDARVVLQALQNRTVLIFDEFDRLKDAPTKSLMADTIKFFSDYSVPSTLVFVGVGKSLSDLLNEHRSVSRNISQIRVDPMPTSELAQIIQQGYDQVGLTYAKGLDEEIAKLSQGYPHYTHLLGLWSGRRTIRDGRTLVTFQDLDAAIPDVLKNAEGGLQEEYERAVDSTKPSALFKQVLLACSLANKDSLGRFAVRAVQDPLKRITGNEYATGAYQAHLGRFCEADRGPVLEKSGRPKSYRWRFLNPQMIPYIILQGINQSMIDGTVVDLRQTV